MIRFRAIAATLGLGTVGLTAHAVSPDPPPPTVTALGQSIFNARWVPNGSGGEGSAERREGLGPLYNASSCAACHPGGARGQGPSGSGLAPIALEIQLEMPGNTQAGDPVYGHRAHVGSSGR
jgi:CxxC motif-containing protein (DUF1111 family)